MLPAVGLLVNDNFRKIEDLLRQETKSDGWLKVTRTFLTLPFPCNKSVHALFCCKSTTTSFDALKKYLCISAGGK